MLLSPAWMDLSTKQKLMYVYMKNQYYGKRKPQKDYPGIEQFQGDDLFYFNLDLAVRYGLYTRSNNRAFYSDIRTIEQHGFIDTVSSGSATKSRSVYRFSSRWQTWEI